MLDQVIIRHLEMQPYEPVWRAMQAFTERRNNEDLDEIWVVEHPPVFTQGLAGKAEHILAAGDIPVVQTDRGGQVTYHGPGQLVVYFLLDLTRKQWGPKKLVQLIEDGVIAFLFSYQIEAHAKKGAPGVYINDAKIASIGLRIRRGCSYHGLSFNVNMDLEPFSRINPCGYQGLAVTQLSTVGGPSDLKLVQSLLLECLLSKMEYSNSN